MRTRMHPRVSGKSLLRLHSVLRKRPTATCALVVSVLLSIGAKVPYCAAQAGLYATASDFIQHRLNYEVHCELGAELHTRRLFSERFVDISDKGQERSFEKDSLYGYRDCSGHDFRVDHVHGVDCEIIDHAGCIVYRATVFERRADGKGMANVVHYYFSSDALSPIVPLTRFHVMHATPGMSRFHDAVLSECQSDNELLARHDGSEHCLVTLLFIKSETVEQNK